MTNFRRPTVTIETFYLTTPRWE